MVTVEDIHPISIRGRFAFAISCLENLRCAWGICSPALDRFIFHLWTFTSVDRRDGWSFGFDLPTPFGDYLLVNNFGLGHLSSEKLRLVHWLLDEFDGIHAGNRFGGPVLGVLNILNRAGVEPPSIENFAASKATESNGWGDPVSPSFFGGPAHPQKADPRWLTSTVIDLTRTIDDQNAFDRLPILADALMDAGCDNDEIISHCRGDGPHVRGCWVIDLLMSKE